MGIPQGIPHTADSHPANRERGLRAAPRRRGAAACARLAFIISGLALAFSSAAPAAAQDGADTAAPAKAPLELAPNAPERHVVVKGDTLWGISKMYLKEPYRWPEIWRLNQDQIKNPHWIYPGQVIVLDTSGATPRLTMEGGGGAVKVQPRIYAEENAQAIPSIPHQLIEPFLTQPLIVDRDGLDKTPRIVAAQEGSFMIGAGAQAYVENASPEVQKHTKLWQIYRPGKALVDPDTDKVLGYEAVYLGNARFIRLGEPATIEVVSANQEIGPGDRLVPAAPPDVINYAPHAPSQAISGRVISIYGGVEEGGRDSIVALSRGKLDGLEIGHVLAMYRSGPLIVNKFEDGRNKTRLPDERYGLVFVFRVFDHVAYGLVLDVNRPVETGDTVRTP